MPSTGSSAPEPVPDRQTDGLLVFATSAALGLGLIGLAALGLGLAGRLNLISGIAILLPGLFLGPLALRAQNRYRSDASAAPASPSKWNWFWLAAAPFLALALIGTMVPPGLLWTPEEPHGYDVVEYHLQVPREWHEAGRIVPLHHNVFSYFPMGVEVHYLLAMHLDGGPLQGMYLAQLMHLTLVVLAVLAVCGIANQIARNRASATVASVALATIPWAAQLGAIAYNEGGLLLFGTLAVGWSMRGLSAQGDSGARLRRFALAGAMAGFACGTKLTAVPELLLGLPAACAAAALCGRRERTVRRGFPVIGELRAALKTGSIFAIVALLVFFPWLARNAVWAGNPVFPEAANILGKAHWNATQVERWERANHEPGPAERGALGRLGAFGDQVLMDWRFGFLLLPLGVLSLVRLAASNRLRNPSVLLPAFILVFLTAFWIGFTHLQGRFYLFGAPLAAILIAQADWGRWLPAVAALVIVSAVVGWWGLNRRFVAIVWRPSPDLRSSLVDALGRGTLEWLNPAEFDSLPKTPEELRRDPARLALIGDSRAFYYQVPMSRLHYRTIFDLDTTGLPAASDGPALVAAWSGRPPGTIPALDQWLLIDNADLRKRGILIALIGGDQWLLIDDAELERFSKFYFDVPPPPPDWAKQAEPLVAKPGR